MVKADSLVVVCGADDRYAMSLAVTLHSALVHLAKGSTLYLYLMDGGVSEKNRRKLERVLKVEGIDVRTEWVQPDLDELSDLKTSHWISSAAYMRLLIPSLLPDDFERAIYLDSDLIIEADLTRLWQSELHDHTLLAVRDYAAPYVSSPSGLATYQELGLSPDTPYFNSGVLVLNMSKWRAEGVSKRIFAYLRAYRDQVRWWDQDGLNAVLAGAWGMLDPRWNQMREIYHFESWPDSTFKAEICSLYDNLVSRPAVIHFNSVPKPWQFECSHPARSTFFAYLKQSGWFGAGVWTWWRSVRGVRYVSWWLRRTSRPFRKAFGKTMKAFVLHGQKEPYRVG